MKSKSEILIKTLRGSIAANEKLIEACAGYNLNPDPDYDLADGLKMLLEWMEVMYRAERKLALSVAPPNMDEDFNLLSDKIQATKKAVEAGANLSVEEVLKRCEYRDGILYLPKVQLTKKAYADVKLWIEEAGGKWKGGKVQGFTFDFDADRVVGILRQGKRCNLAQEFQFFETPDETADWLVSLVGELRPDMKILEPSAGRGAIVRAVHRACPDVMVDCYELMPENKQRLMNVDGVRLIGDDFTKEEYPDSYDIIVANPPFSKNQDVRHVRQMYAWLKPGGVMAAITSKHWQMGSERECVKFKEWLDEVNATLFEIPEGTFKQSGTGVGTIAIVIIKN